ncbi:MAG: tetratricopeptide repeat protein [Bacteroidaceae bacterium]|nr:tetratricopeptide repeat protein [Bacteroidaceae bacterium]
MMAYKTRNIPLLIIFIFLFSCTSQEERELSALLNHADSLMRTRPDSSLYILNKVETLPTTSLSMRHALLRADALNKCDSVLPSDTLLRELTDYYDRHGSANERMRAHYLLGRCYHDMGEAPRALECYQHAAEQADTSSKDCDFYTLSTSFYQTAELFRRQGLFSLEVEQLEKATHYAFLAQDTLSAIDHYYYMGVAYLQMKDTIRAISITNQAADIFRKRGYREYASQCLSGMILPLIEKKRYSEARHAISEYETYSGYFHDGDISPGREIFYYMKGMYYIGIHQYDSALSCFRKELQTGMDFNNQLAAAHGLAITYKEIGDADSTAKYAMIAYALNDSAYSIETAQHIAQTQSMYNYGRIQQIANQKEKTNNRLRLMLLGSLFSVISVMLIAYLLYIEIKKKRSENERMRKDLEESKTFLEETRHELSLLKKMKTLSDDSDLQNEQLRNVIKEKEIYIARLRSRISYYQSRLNPKSLLKQDSWISESSVISLFHNYANHPKSTPLDNDWQELFAFVDNHVPDFYAILSNNGTLKTTQYKLCYLLRAGLSNSEVTVLLADEISNITMACKNLHKKILGKDGKASDFRHFLVNIHT